MIKKKLIVKEKDLIFYLSSLIIPLIITLILEHFGEFKYSYQIGGLINEVEINTITFSSPIGNEITLDVTNDGVRYERTENGYEINSSYFSKLPYYFKALYHEIWYPLIATFFLIVLNFLYKKFSIVYIEE